MLQREKQFRTSVNQGVPAPAKTLNISELGAEEKTKYFDFLLESNINFQEDADGNMVFAKVKIRAKNPIKNSCNKENASPLPPRSPVLQTKKPSREQRTLILLGQSETDDNIP